MHFDADKYVLLLDAYCKFPDKLPKGQQQQRQAITIPFIKIVITGDSGRKTGHHDDEYYQFSVRG